MKKNFLFPGILVTIIFSGITALAQPPAPPVPFKERIFFGGGIGGGIGSSGSAFDISPVVGYRITDKFSVGAGPIYQFYSNKIIGIRANNYGGQVFARHTIWQSVFAQVQYELLNLQYFYPDFSSGTILSERRNVGSFFVGGGISQSLGGRASIQLIALYNLNQTKYSPREPLYLTMGFGFGF